MERRSVVDQTPTTALRARGPETARPSLVTSELGTWSTNEWALKPATSSLPPPWLPSPIAGRPGLSMLMPSKIDPRSTKNASSAGPTNDLPPPGRPRIAPLEMFA